LNIPAHNRAVGHRYRAKVTRLEVLCHDIPAESGVGGLLGLNFLRHFKLTIRPRKGIIELAKER